MIVRRPALMGVTALAIGSTACLVATWWVVAASPQPGDVLYAAVIDTIGVFSLVMGVIVATRRPRNVVGVLIAAFGFVPCLITLNDSYISVQARLPGQFPLSGYFVALTQGLWMLWYVPAALLMLTFPGGRLLSRRWRVVPVALFADVVLFAVDAAFLGRHFDSPDQHLVNPLPAPAGVVSALVNVGAAVCLLGFLAVLIACVCAVVIRYRRARGAECAQLKWFVLGAGALPGCLLLCWTSYLLLNNDHLLLFGLLLLLVSVPVATVIGLLRHDLYDVDRAASAAATYAVVTTGLLAMFTLASFIGGLALGHRSPIVAAAATAICAAALSPLRNRLRSAIDSRLYPVRGDALRSIDALRTRIHDGQARPEQLTEVLSAALKDPRLRVGYRVPGSQLDVDVDGRPVTEPGVSVVLAGETVGVLVASPGRSRALLREVAAAAAFMVEVVRLRAGLGQALRDVESSRARLLQASYDERRRLERDLHDGAQQRLVALGMKLRVAQRHLADGTVDVNQLIDGSVAELTNAVADLRQIAHGLRPSSLDDGLGPALTTLIGGLPVPVQMQIEPADLPDEIATTAFFVISEAVTNAIKHAQASEIELTVRRVGQDLLVSVTDNGVGTAVQRPGAGLSGLGDRVAAAGGVLQVRSQPGHGTCIEAVLPCAS